MNNPPPDSVLSDIVENSFGGRIPEICKHSNCILKNRNINFEKVISLLGVMPGVWNTYIPYDDNNEPINLTDSKYENGFDSVFHYWASAANAREVVSRRCQNNDISLVIDAWADKAVLKRMAALRSADYTDIYSKLHEYIDDLGWMYICLEEERTYFLVVVSNRMMKGYKAIMDYFEADGETIRCIRWHEEQYKYVVINGEQ